MGYSEWLASIVRKNAEKGIGVRPFCPKCGAEMVYSCKGACGYRCPRCGTRKFNVAVISK